MSGSFFETPVINSPYELPRQHWELDPAGQPTNRIIATRRRSDLITPVPKPKKQRQNAKQASFLAAADDLSTDEQEYNPTPIINEVRGHVETWRNLPNPDQWLVTPETARLLKHWRHTEWQSLRPFFCQVEAVETAIWLVEVAPKMGARVAKFRAHLEGANAGANPELMRLALKLATGAGKTTVMAMLIAWQTVNAVRAPNSKTFSRGFLVVAPGITIKDRLRVLLPNDPESYYRHRDIVPPDMLADMDRAKIVITNYHTFKLRERIDIAKGTREAIEGWEAKRDPKDPSKRMQTLETEGQMLQRVMPDLMGMKNVVVLNDEAHHCYRERVRDRVDEDLKGDDKDEADENNEAARMWITGLETVKRKLGLALVYDLSATPFFLRGSGYLEGTLFPWTMSDFSLMDAIECGIVKLPRVPVADNVPGGDMPKFRDLWEQLKASPRKLPKKGRTAGKAYDPLELPVLLISALEALYGHYEKTFAVWQEAGIGVPPVFIVVCNNTSTSEIVYKYISGFHREETGRPENGRLKLFDNYDDFGNRRAKPNTILIDSSQLESGEALDKDFRAMAAGEIERFRRDILDRGGADAEDIRRGNDIDDATLLREVMNTVGKKGRLGEQVRCVVSVSMLTEGWDANTVTHVLGVRAFGTQLLCEQVVGRALRRQSYELNEQGLFNVEYADILGIPFNFTAKPVVALPAKPRETIRVHAVSPERDALEIAFPRVEGYRVELPDTRLEARFGPDHVLKLTPELVGPSITENRGIIGASVDLTLKHLDRDMRHSTLVYELATYLLMNKYRDPGGEPRMNLFGQLRRVTRQWLDAGCLVCEGDTYPGLLKVKDLADMAAERIKAAITETLVGEKPVKAILDPYNPKGSTRFVNFTTSKELRWDTIGPPPKCPVNWVICDSDWEAEFCRVAEAHPRVRAYVKNQALGFEAPYLMGAIPRRYLPDFIVRVDDGRPDLLNLVVEVKGYRGEDAKEKANTMRAYWVPGVNNLGTFGRWAFAEFTAVYEMDRTFGELIDSFVAEVAAT